MQKPWCSNTEERRKTATNPATENTGLENATVSNTERENALIYLQVAYAVRLSLRVFALSSAAGALFSQ